MLPSKKSKIEPVHVEEAGKLKALFDERNKLSQLAFGQRFEIGSQGMVWQYLNAKAPLNLDAALKFARALDCSVAEFSPRLASALGAPASQGRENGGEKDSPSSRHLSNIDRHQKLILLFEALTTERQDQLIRDLQNAQQADEDAAERLSADRLEAILKRKKARRAIETGQFAPTAPIAANSSDIPALESS